MEDRGDNVSKTVEQRKCQKICFLYCVYNVCASEVKQLFFFFFALIE